MITDIPTYKEFEQEGISLLNLAWDLVIPLMLEYDELESAFANTSRSFDDAYWVAAQRSLTTSISLVQQGVEFLLKGKISQVSSFLLIAGNPKDWPRGCHNQDTSFSNFKTVDAQDLIRVHDTVADSKLPQSFITWYETMRSLRNTIMHTVDKSIIVNSTQVVTAILDAFDFLVISQGWIESRDDYLKNAPNYIIDTINSDYKDISDGYRLAQLSRETFKVIELLEPSLVKKYFGFDKKARKYICLYCLEQMEKQHFFEFDLDESSLFPAQLRPNTPESETISCILCNIAQKVERKACSDSDCKSNAIDFTSSRCLVCLEPS